MRPSRKCIAQDVIIALALVATLNGCGATEPAEKGDGAPASTAPSSAAPGSDKPTTQAERPEVKQAVEQFGAYVDLWAARGWNVAGRRYLWRFKPSDTTSSGDLKRGRLIGHELRSWHGPRDFELLVQLELRFAGSPGIWQEGTNAVFVTPHRTASDRYRFEINSGPSA